MGVPAYILAGGNSSRFGSDKARAMLDGRYLIARVRSMLEPVASTITVVADQAGKYADLGMQTIGDLQPGMGPLAGLQTALHDLPQTESWLLLCTCDALVIQPHWLFCLLEERESSVDAVAFRGDYWQPMPGLYCSSCMSTVDKQIRAVDLSMQNLLHRLATRSLPMPQDWPEYWQVNSRADLELVKRQRKAKPSQPE